MALVSCIFWFICSEFICGNPIDLMGRQTIVWISLHECLLPTPRLVCRTKGVRQIKSLLL